jgi:lysophospholipase L1-like esterase
MMPRTILATALTLLLSIGVSNASESQLHEQCRVPDPMLSDEDRLPATGRALARSQDINVIVLGGGGTQGMGGSGLAAAWPTKFSAALAEALGRKVDVVNLGRRRQIAADVLQRLDQDVIALKPTLVVWETGTVDAARGIEPEEFSRALARGVRLMQRAGIDVVLVDPQFVGATQPLLNMAPFVEAMRQISAKDQLVKFDRYEIMRHWLEIGFIRQLGLSRDAMVEENDKVFDCVGKLLAQLVARQAAASRPR